MNDLSSYTESESGALVVEDGGSAATGSVDPMEEGESSGPGEPDESGQGPESPGSGGLEVPSVMWGGIDGGAGADPGPDPARELVPFAISSAEPADGALGVPADVVLVIDFGRAMDPSTVGRAIDSDDLPLAGASFTWNGENSVLRITLAEPLALATGTDPSQVTARCHSYRISEAALDAEGQAVIPSRIGFCTLRSIVRTLTPLGDPNVTGNFRSDGTYGDGACGRGANAFCVGDSGFAANSSYRGFLTFDSSALLDSELVASAELQIDAAPETGTPFEALGELLVERSRFQTIDTGAFTSNDVSGLGRLRRARRGESTLVGDVTETLEGADDDRLQLRLRFAQVTDGDNGSDHIIAAVNSVELTVQYLLP